jgi:hypothetical protein
MQERFKLFRDVSQLRHYHDLVDDLADVTSKLTIVVADLTSVRASEQDGEIISEAIYEVRCSITLLKTVIELLVDSLVAANQPGRSA